MHCSKNLCVNVLASSNKSAMIRALIKVEAELQGIRGKRRTKRIRRHTLRERGSDEASRIYQYHLRGIIASMDVPFNKKPKASISVNRSIRERWPDTVHAKARAAVAR